MRNAIKFERTFTVRVKESAFLGYEYSTQATHSEFNINSACVCEGIRNKQISQLSEGFVESEVLMFCWTLVNERDYLITWVDTLSPVFLASSPLLSFKSSIIDQNRPKNDSIRARIYRHPGKVQKDPPEDVKIWSRFQLVKFCDYTILNF